MTNEREIRLVNRRHFLTTVVAVSGGCLRQAGTARESTTSPGSSSGTQTGNQVGNANSAQTTPTTKAQDSKPKPIELEKLWSAGPSDDVYTDGNLVYLCEGNSVRACDAESGDTKWETETSSQVWENSLTITDSTIYASGLSNETVETSTTGSIDAFDKKMGEPKWSFTGDRNQMLPSPAVGDGLVICADQKHAGGFGDDAGAILRGLDAETGKKQWQRTVTNGPVHSLIAMSGRVFAAINKKVYQIDTQTGSIMRYKPLTNGLGLRADSGHLYANIGKDLGKYDPNANDEIWSTQIVPESIGMAIYNFCVSKSRVYATTEEGIVAVSKDNGEQLWKTSTEFDLDHPTGEQQPVVMQGFVWVIDSLGRAIAFDEKTGEKVYRSDPSSNDSGHIDCSDDYFVVTNDQLSVYRYTG